MTKTKFEKIKIINDLLTWITRVASVSGRFAWSCAFVPLSIVAVNPLAPRLVTFDGATDRPSIVAVNPLAPRLVTFDGATDRPSIVAVNPLAPLVALLRLHRQRGDRAGF